MKSTVLLVDDDPVDLKALALLLDSWDYDVLEARSGERALTALREQPVDLVLSDVRMPGMTGEDMVRAVGSEFAGLPVVLITGQGDVRSAVTAMKLGAFDYVVKPPDEEEFRLTIERAIDYSRLHRENAFLRAEMAAGGKYGERLIGRSPTMLELFEMINRVARSDSTVLITGDTGTGKELVAQTIHYKSPRARRPFVAMNCAAVNANLIESELFGHEKGAFTGAVSSRRGRFEEADGGTLLLDEIGETTPDFQAKLLRVLQEGIFERVGGNKQIQVDVRVLASTNRDLKAEIEEGNFREDLFYRISVIPINVPPLRERREDIALLAAHFLSLYSERYGSPVKSLSREAMDWLVAQKWKGNVRELQHALERAVVLARGDVLEKHDFRLTMGATEQESDRETLHNFVDARTREYVVRVLEENGWRKGKTAKILGVDRATLYRLLQRLSIEET